MIITNYHEVTALTLSPLKTLPVPDQVAWRVLQVETATETHVINFFLKDAQQDIVGFQKKSFALIPKVEILGANQTCVRVKDRAYFYSYQDCIGFQCGNVKVFRDEEHSLATKKHIATMCKGFKPAPPSYFYALISE